MGPFHVKHPGSVYPNRLSPPLGRHLARLELARERAGPLDSVATAMLIPTRRPLKPTLRTDDGSMFHVKHLAACGCARFAGSLPIRTATAGKEAFLFGTIDASFRTPQSVERRCAPLPAGARVTEGRLPPVGSTAARICE